MKDNNLPVLFLHKNKKRGDLVNVWAMGWGHSSLLRSGSLRRCQQQKDKRLWTDYSRLDIKHHLRYDGTYRLSLFMELSQGVDVNNVMPCMLPGHVSQGPFHGYRVPRHLVNRARNDVLHKNKKKLFSICPANYPRKSGTWPLQTTLHPLARRAGLVPVFAQGVVTSLIEPYINDILEKEPLSLFSSNWVPPFSCCFRFLLKFSALEKFTTTGAGCGLLTTSSPVGNIMFV